MKAGGRIGKYAFLWLISCFLIAGCNSGQENNSSTESVKNTEPADSIVPVTDTVVIKDMKFQPAILSVRPGDTILFMNRDMVTHDITEEYKRWSSSPLPAGESWKMVFTQTCNYYCSIHLMMKGRLEIN